MLDVGVNVGTHSCYTLSNPHTQYHQSRWEWTGSIQRQWVWLISLLNEYLSLALFSSSVFFSSPILLCLFSAASLFPAFSFFSSSLFYTSPLCFTREHANKLRHNDEHFKLQITILLWPTFKSLQCHVSKK